MIVTLPGDGETNIQDTDSLKQNLSSTSWFTYLTLAEGSKFML